MAKTEKLGFIVATKNRNARWFSLKFYRLWCQTFKRTEKKQALSTSCEICFATTQLADHHMFSRKTNSEFWIFTTFLTDQNESLLIICHCFLSKQLNGFKDSWKFGIIFSWKHMVTSSYNLKIARLMLSGIFLQNNFW